MRATQKKKFGLVYWNPVGEDSIDSDAIGFS
jgi:hypothetical protein